jgi:hypothetical protein
MKAWHFIVAGVALVVLGYFFHKKKLADNMASVRQAKKDKANERTERTDTTEGVSNGG